MTKPVILYLIRAEADLERIVSLAIPGKKYADQHLIFFGDMSMIFQYGVKNEFQKYLLKSNDLDVIDAISFTIFGRIYNLFYKRLLSSEKKLILRILLKGLRKIIFLRQKQLSDHILKKINPNFLVHIHLLKTG